MKSNGLEKWSFMKQKYRFLYGRVVIKILFRPISLYVLVVVL